MNAASQVPSGVLISTLVSTTSMPAAAAEPAAAASPAATPSATKSRLFLRSFVSSAMLFLLLLNALHPLENRLGNAGIRGIGRHHFRDVAVILEHHVSRTFSRFAQFTLQGLGKCDDVPWIKFGNGKKERHLGFHQAWEVRPSQLNSGVRLSCSALSTAWSARSASGRRCGSRLPVRLPARPESALNRGRSGRQTVKRRRRHENHAFDSHSLGTIVFGMTDVSAHGHVPGGLRPEEHAPGISLEFSDVFVQPEKGYGNVLRGIVPSLPGTALHVHSHHAVSNRPHD